MHKRIGWTYLKEYVIKEEFEKHKEFAKEKHYTITG